MLGLGSSVNNEEGYAKGERYRERYHTGGTYNETTNPLGREGSESDYIGDFATGTDDDLYQLVNAGSSGIDGGEFKYRTSAILGYAWIAFSVVPNTGYSLLCTYDKTSTANGNGRVYIGTSAGDGTIADSGVLVAGNTDAKVDFNSANNNYLFLSLLGTTSGKFSYWDDISLKES